MPDFIVPGMTGELVPPGRPQALGDAIAGVLRDAQRRREMGDQGRKRFTLRFSANVNIPKIGAILAEAAGQA
jgi:glycosyltransferase involved in cell wall biosynthesis